MKEKSFTKGGMKMRKSKKIKIFVLMIGIIVTVLFLGNTSVRAEKQEEKTVRVGYIKNYGIIKYDGRVPYGYGVDYLNALSEYTGHNYEYYGGTEQELERWLKSGKLDIICGVIEKVEKQDTFLYSNMHMGVQYSLIYAKKENTNIFFQDYEAFNGMRIGILKDSLQESLFDTYVEKHELENVNKYYYASLEELFEALSKNEVSAITYGGLPYSENRKVIDKYAITPCYLMTTNENKVIMDELEEATEKLYIEKPYFDMENYSKNYGVPAETLMGITREEYEYIEENKKLKVAVDSSSYPVEYIDELGKYKGIYADILKLIEKETGFTFEYVTANNYSSCWDMLKKGEVDLISSVYGNEKNGEDYNAAFSHSFLDMRNIIIGKRGIDVEEGKTLGLAMPKGYVGLQYYMREKYPNWKITFYDDVKECIKAVENGEQDVTMVNSVFLQTIIDLTDYENITIISTINVSVPMSVGISKQKPTIVKQILDKAILSIPQKEFSECIVKNSINIPFAISFHKIFKNAIPWILGIILCFSSALIIYITKSEKHYKKLAMYDSVTGVWSYSKFEKEAKELLQKKRNQGYYILSIDIDKFKYINENFGYDRGDLVLGAVALNIKKLFKENTMYCRVGADEFAILLEEIPKEILIGKIEQLIQLHQMFWRKDENPFNIKIKVGIYNIEKGQENYLISKALDHAKMAKKLIKGSINMAYAFYNDELERQIEYENEIEGLMDQALANREFLVYYQPKYDLNTERIIGAEALVRWDSPQKGFISPGDFVPIFEKNGFIIKLDYFVYEEVFSAMRKWLDEGKKIVPISINVSRAHLSMNGFVSDLISMIEKYELPEQYIEVELTESIFGQNNIEARKIFYELKEYNLKVSIDDFGSGYSTLNLLKNLPVDVLKLDKGFLDESGESERSSVIIEEIIKLAKRIHVKTICEGVETEKQVEFLKKIGCDMIQGFWYSKPIPLEEFEEKLNLL